MMKALWKVLQCLGLSVARSMLADLHFLLRRLHACLAFTILMASDAKFRADVRRYSLMYAKLSWLRCLRFGMRLMLKVQRARLKHAQTGLSLPELLISMAIGLLLALFACTFLYHANHNFAAQRAAGELDDAGRFAIDNLSRSVRQAGYRSLGATAGVAGLDARSISKGSEGISDAIADVANGSDVLALRFDGAGKAAAGDGSMLNCAGFSEGQGTAPAWSIYYVARAADGETELRCKYRGASSWGADAIVRGVDSFQVLYGLDTDADGVANSYVNASVIDRNPDNWRHVTEVRLALLLHATDGANEDRPTRVFDLFDPVYSRGFAGGDPGTQVREDLLAPGVRTRMRRVYSATIALRNPSQ